MSKNQSLNISVVTIEKLILRLFAIIPLNLNYLFQPINFNLLIRRGPSITALFFSSANGKILWQNHLRIEA
jgi:hypothetical protein